MRQRGLRGGNDFFLGNIGQPITDVVPNGVMEQDVFLRHHGDLPAQRTKLGFPDVAAIHANGAGSDVIKSRQEIDERGLARATRADKSDQLAFAGAESNVAQNGSGIVRETNVFKANLAGKSGKFGGAGSVLALFGEVKVGKDLGRSSLGLLELLIDGANSFDGLVGFEQRVNEGNEHSRGHQVQLYSVAGVKQQQRDDHRLKQIHERRCGHLRADPAHGLAQKPF